MSTPPLPSPAPSGADVKIQDFRLSFTWVETLPGAAGWTTPLAPAFSFLRKNDLYAKAFRDALTGASPAGLEVPWKEHKKQFFWKYYLGGPALNDVSGGQAWEHLVPLRTKLPFLVKNWGPGYALLEGFCYPHGLALVVTCRVITELSLPQAVELAYRIKNGEEKFSVESVKKLTNLSLESLAENGLTWLREAVLGKKAQAGKQRDVFTVFTVVKAEPLTRFELGAEVHRALQAITEWSPDPDTATLLPLDDVKVPVKKSTAGGSMLFARRRARAIWFPGLFAKKDPKKPSLGCYHRNQLFAAMQVDSLGGLVKATFGLLKDGTPLYKLDPTLKTCTRNAIERLEELYLGDRDRSYRSSSPRLQIDQNDLNELNSLRHSLNGSANDLGPVAETVTTPAAPPKEH